MTTLTYPIKNIDPRNELGKENTGAWSRVRVHGRENAVLSSY